MFPPMFAVIGEINDDGIVQLTNFIKFLDDGINGAVERNQGQDLVTPEIIEALFFFVGEEFFMRY